MAPKKKAQAPPLTTEIPRHRMLLGCALSLAAFLLYAETLNYGFVLDDAQAITRNDIVKQGIHGIPELLRTDYQAGTRIARGTLYRPLSLVMFAVEWHFYPNDPFPGHLVNVLLYALTVWVLFTFLGRLMPDTSVLIPISITLLFLVHPIHSEVVANIKSRDEILSFLLAVLALTLSLRRENTGTLIFAGALYLLSLLSKESAITVLGVLPFMLYFFTKKTMKQNLLQTGVFACAAFIYLVLRRLVLGEITASLNVSAIDNFLVLAGDFNTKTATALEISGKYLSLMFFPHPLSVDYAYNQIPIVTWADYRPLLSVAAYLVLIGLAAARVQKKEVWVFGVIFYLMTMSLYTNLFITIGTAFGERLLYLPSLGFCISLVALLAKLWPLTDEAKQL
jgi:hypothetical protein